MTVTFMKTSFLLILKNVSFYIIFNAIFLSGPKWWTDQQTDTAITTATHLATQKMKCDSSLDVTDYVSVIFSQV